jgi:uncharacterized repeat protein (TIGR03803 family)
MTLESAFTIVKRILALAFVLGLASITLPTAHAQRFSVVHNFLGSSDGGYPLAGLTVDPAGNFYGTASDDGAYAAGLVYKITPGGVQTVLYNFAGGNDGFRPESSLLRDAAGNLYGTTLQGGTSNAGTAYVVTSAGKETVLYSFSGTSDGGSPLAALAMDSAGNLYGTTTAGGSNNNGTVFELVRPQKGGQWKEKVLHSFGASADGGTPIAGVTLDAAGNLYGTASVGGKFGYGRVYELLSKSKWKEQVIHDFQLGNDGGTPYAGLVFDGAGNLYGGTTSGGKRAGGTIFQLTPSNGEWKFNLVVALSGWEISGPFRNLYVDASGTIYGTTHCDGKAEAGTAYRITRSGNKWDYHSLHVFTGGADGLYAYTNLVLDKKGNVYGTTYEGGANGHGVLFRIKP